MSELSELAMATISQAQRRVEIAAQNLSNANTPSYKRQIVFSTLVDAGNSAEANIPSTSITSDARPGKLVETGNSFNFAISGSGYFAFRREGNIIYSRNGQLTIDGEGRLINSEGYALQLSSGRDLVVTSNDFEVLTDGNVRYKGQILGAIAVFDLAKKEAGASVADSYELVPAPSVIQGMIEASNVTTGDEMVAMIEALRRAESGQRIMNVYDDLMGRVITTFGDSAR
jgi:flagellar basal-body rod protein FlgF